MPKTTAITPAKSKAILADYKRVPRLSVSAIAKKHSVSSSAVSILAKEHDLPQRKRGCATMAIPTSRHLEILAAMAEPNATMDSVGKKFGGISRQRVHQIVSMWRGRGQELPEKEKFAPGDTIEWNNERYVVKTMSQDGKSGTVTDSEGYLIDNFKFNYQGAKAVKVQ